MLEPVEEENAFLRIFVLQLPSEMEKNRKGGLKRKKKRFWHRQLVAEESWRAFNIPRVYIYFIYLLPCGSPLSTAGKLPTASSRLQNVKVAAVIWSSLLCILGRIELYNHKNITHTHTPTHTLFYSRTRSVELYARLFIQIRAVSTQLKRLCGDNKFGMVYYKILVKIVWDLFFKIYGKIGQILFSCQKRPNFFFKAINSGRRKN